MDMKKDKNRNTFPCKRQKINGAYFCCVKRQTHREADVHDHQLSVSYFQEEMETVTDLQTMVSEMNSLKRFPNFK